MIRTARPQLYPESGESIVVGPLRVGLRWSPSSNSSRIAVQNFPKLGLALFVFLVRGVSVRGESAPCQPVTVFACCLFARCARRARALQFWRRLTAFQNSSPLRRQCPFANFVRKSSIHTEQITRPPLCLKSTKPIVTSLGSRNDRR